MPKNVLVTGANGHVGGVLVRELVDNGYTVRASVRDPEDAQKTAALRELGVEIVKADLFDVASLEAACAGMDGLFQVAAVYDFNPKSAAAAQTMIDTGIQGMENALRVAHKAGVKRIVLTSSMVTVGPVMPGQPDVTEETWTDDISVPYLEEKWRGEKRAWELADELQLDLVSVLPAGVYGPGFSRSTSSTDIIEAICKGSLRMGAPKMDLPFVDVRDTATAHRLAYEKGISGQRYIAMHSAPMIGDVALAVAKAYPKAGKPMMTMPDFMIGMVPAFSALMSKISDVPHTYTRAMHKCWGGRNWRFDDSKTRQALGFTPQIGVEQSMKDTVAQLKAIGRVR